MIIAFEDVGLGACEAVLATVTSCADPALRKSTGGNVRTVLELSRRLAEAPKDRSADHLIAAAAEHPRLESTRRQMVALQPASRLAMVADSSLPLTVRATAAWYASGLEWQRERRILGGEPGEGIADRGSLTSTAGIRGFTRGGDASRREQITK
jgi:hypothetical protein